MPWRGSSSHSGNRARFSSSTSFTGASVADVLVVTARLPYTRMAARRAELIPPAVSEEGGCNLWPLQLEMPAPVKDVTDGRAITAIINHRLGPIYGTSKGSYMVSAVRRCSVLCASTIQCCCVCCEIMIRKSKIRCTVVIKIDREFHWEAIERGEPQSCRPPLAFSPVLPASLKTGQISEE